MIRAFCSFKKQGIHRHQSWNIGRRVCPPDWPNVSCYIRAIVTCLTTYTQFKVHQICSFRLWNDMMLMSCWPMHRGAGGLLDLGPFYFGIPLQNGHYSAWVLFIMWCWIDTSYTRSNFTDYMKDVGTKSFVAWVWIYYRREPASQVKLWILCTLSKWASQWLYIFHNGCIACLPLSTVVRKGHGIIGRIILWRVQLNEWYSNSP